ncbi:UNVERIFIED_CONTAM: UDP glycosyltransferase 9 [Sesamum radiatum]|uniref:Glycosyltransferase n=1 Tax=Sesamum radiatum TaxID=300843 RepID=A0AAW2LRT2_SESRA
MEQETATKTHILAIPFPLQGHINPMVQLCNRLVPRRIHVTLVTTVSFGASLQIQALSSTMISIETVPDPPIDVPEDVDEYEIFHRRFRAAITSGLPGIIRKQQSNAGVRFKAIVLLPHVRGCLEIQCDEGSEVSLPGMPVLGLKDLPSLVYDMSSYPSLLRVFVKQFSTFEKADWRLFNTFDKLEEEILKWMANKYPIRTIGPTVPSMYTDKRLLGNYDYGLSLFKPNTDSCMKWLDNKQDRSVIYVSFGSLADLVDKQMREVAWGLIDSKLSFLWVVRDTEESKLPQDFTSGLHDNGLIVNWCSQLEVLSHRAIGCFVTHGGWNSTLEALSLGVPMVVMPQWTDQMTNAKLVADVWRIGVRMTADENGIVMREEIAAAVHDVMQGERGRVIRSNAVKWKDLAIEAVGEGGSSDNNFTEFAMELLRT